jgi:hypothetical protein
MSRCAVDSEAKADAAIQLTALRYQRLVGRIRNAAMVAAMGRLNSRSRYLIRNVALSMSARLFCFIRDAAQDG